MRIKVTLEESVTTHIAGNIADSVIAGMGTALDATMVEKLHEAGKNSSRSRTITLTTIEEVKYCIEELEGRAYEVEEMIWQIDSTEDDWQSLHLELPRLWRSASRLQAHLEEVTK